MKLNTLENKVEHILEVVPDTRNNNELLAAYIRKGILKAKNVRMADYNAEQLPYLCAMYNLPSVESITRARRKVVERRDDLRPSKEIQEFRHQQEKQYVEYARS